MAVNSGKAVLSGMVEKVAFVNKWPMLMKATSDDNTPTAGYLYKEITDLSYASSGFCTSLLDFLVDRLDKSSFHIKVKVLKILKHVVGNGHGDFKVGLRRQAIGIQNAIKYSGNPDPLHGNAPYIAVRNAAMELSEILFDTEQSASPKKQAGNMSQTKMQGFGNSPTHQPQASRSLTDVIKGGVEQLTNNLTKPETCLETGSATDYQPISGLSGQRSQVNKQHYGRSSSKRDSGKANEYKPVDICGAACNAKVENLQESRLRPTPGGSWGNQNMGSEGSNDSSGQKSAASTESEKLASVAMEDWSQEIKLVEDFIAASNVKPTPSRMELSQFAKRCSTSSSEKVLELLDNRLSNHSQAAMQMRGLCAVEAIIREDLVSVERAQEIVQTNLGVLSRSEDNLVQAKAKKISKQLERLVQEAMDAQKTRSPLHDISAECLVQMGTKPHNIVPVHSDHQNTESLAELSTQLSTTRFLTTQLQTTQMSTNLDATQQPNSLFSGMSIGQRKQDSAERNNSFGFNLETIGLAHNDEPNSAVSKTKTKNLLLDVESQYGKQSVIFDEERSSGIDKHTYPGEPFKISPEMSLLTNEPIKETVLDTILDLSSTEQATLEPMSHRKMEPSSNTSQLLRATDFDAVEQSETRHSSTIGSETKQLSRMGPETGHLSTKGPGCKQLSTTGYVQSATTPANLPGAKRTSRRDDLLASIDPLSKSTPQVNNRMMSSSPANIPPTKSLGGQNVEDLGLYPQLSKSHLSGMSAVPLSLSSKAKTNKFAFVETEDDKKEKRTKSGQEEVFGFVNDAIAKAGGKR